MICTLLSNSIGIVTQKNGFDKLLSQILKKILTIAFLFAQNVQKIKKPRRVVGAVYIGKSVFFLCEVVDFFDERTKHAESLCKTVLVYVLCKVEASVIIAGKIEVHCGYARAVKAALSECRRIGCSESYAAFFALCVLLSFKGVSFIISRLIRIYRL